MARICYVYIYSIYILYVLRIHRVENTDRLSVIAVKAFTYKREENEEQCRFSTLIRSYANNLKHLRLGVNQKDGSVRCETARKPIRNARVYRDSVNLLIVRLAGHGRHVWSRGLDMRKAFKLSRNPEERSPPRSSLLSYAANLIAFARWTLQVVAYNIMMVKTFYHVLMAARQ